MLDPALLRHSLQEVVVALARRCLQVDAVAIAKAEAECRDARTRLQELQQQRRSLAKEVGAARKRGEDAAPLQQQGHELGEEIRAMEASLEKLEEKWRQVQLEIPNMPHPAVPAGADESFNVELRRVGEVDQEPGDAADHVSIGEQLGMMDFAAAAAVSGARFVVLRKELARLHRALAQFMLDLHIREHGYEEINVPQLVLPDALEGTGQLPKFADDLFKVEGGGLFLIPTSEVPVTNTVRDTILDASELPLRWVCHSMCYRSEAGSYGRDTRGMIRQHQFEKVELVQVVHPDESETVHEELTRHAERVLLELGLPYRVVDLCGGDLGFAASRTYDIEVWLPGQKRYREISSCSNFRDFQARRMRTRIRQPDGSLAHAHTLNGSGLAVGRALVAVLENCYQGDGTVALPTALQPYMGGSKTISAARA